MKTLIALIAACVSQTAVAQWHGLLITDPDHIDEVAAYSNAFAYMPRSEQDLAEVLAVNAGRMMPVVDLAGFFWNEATGTYVWRNISGLKAAIGNNQILAEVDEPFWHIQQSCMAGVQSACNEIASGYAQTQQVFRRLKYELGVQLVHIEAYTALINHKEVDPDRPVPIIDAADHVGFNCYGDFHDCGGYSQLQYGAWLYEAILGTSKKILLVAGSFLAPGFFDTEQQVIDQIEAYYDIFQQYRDLFSGIGLFLYSSVDGFTGARDLPQIRSVVQRLHWRSE